MKNKIEIEEKLNFFETQESNLKIDFTFGKIRIDVFDFYSNTKLFENFCFLTSTDEIQKTEQMLYVFLDKFGLTIKPKQKEILDDSISFENEKIQNSKIDFLIFEIIMKNEDKSKTSLKRFQSEIKKGKHVKTFYKNQDNYKFRLNKK